MACAAETETARSALDVYLERNCIFAGKDKIQCSRLEDGFQVCFACGKSYCDAHATANDVAYANWNAKTAVPFCKTCGLKCAVPLCSTREIGGYALRECPGCRSRVCATCQWAKCQECKKTFCSICAVFPPEDERSITGCDFPVRHRDTNAQLHTFTWRSCGSLVCRACGERGDDCCIRWKCKQHNAPHIQLECEHKRKREAEAKGE